MKERLRAADYRFILICAALLTATVWFSVKNFYRAFPEASIDFKVNRDEAAVLAAKFLTAQGHLVEGYRHASQFTYDEDAKTFLEREVGLEQANRLMGSRVRLWKWAHRWFRPLQKEEYSVAITPRGELVGFDHQLPEDAERPPATAEQARLLAEDFLRSRMSRDPASLDFVESQDIVRPRRTDRTFTWKERDFDLHDATYRIEVTLLGNQIGGYREYLKVPEQWLRDYQKLRSKNEAAQLVDTAVTLLLMIGMSVVIVTRVRRHDVPWRRAALVGLIGMVLAFLAQLNEFPLHEFSYPTTDSYGSFLSRQLLQAVLAALGAGGLLFVLTAGAEPLYREAFPGKIALGNLFMPRGFRTKRFFLGAILGITLTGIFIAYQTGFYIVAYRFGAWSPADVPYTDLLNTKFPWAFVLFGGFLPAVSEEFLFRMFAIPFLRKLVRSWIPALVLAGFIWGFGHAGYPQQPFFIRGVEVGIGGIALGIVMLRWGILPTLVWHYSVDAMYSAMLLVRSENLYMKLSGVIAAGIVVLPVVAALVMYLRSGGFESEEGLLNRDEAAAPEAVAIQPAEPVPGATVPYQPMRRARRWVAAGVFVLGIASLAIPVSHFGRSPVYRISAGQARKASDEFLHTQGVDPAAFEYVTYPAVHWGGADELAGKYFLERMPLDRASAMFEHYRPVQHWLTRYFRALDREEMSVSVHPETGRVRSVSHTIPEDRPGADLPPERAREIAAAFAASMGWDVSAMDLKESASEKKKARRDYTLVWEARPGDPRNVGEARWRVEVVVAGDRAVSVGGLWKLPETFERERGRANAISIVLLVARIVVFAGLVVWGIWMLIQAVRHGTVQWGQAIRLALPGSVLLPVSALLSISLVMKNYDTAIPLDTFRTMTYVGVVMTALLAFLMLAAAAAIVTAFFPETLAALRRTNRRAMGLDAAAAVLAAIGLALLANQLGAALVSRFHAQALPQIGSPDLIASKAPAISAFAMAVPAWLRDAAALALIALLAFRARRPWMIAAGAIVAIGALLPGGVRTAGEFTLYYTISLIAAICAVAFCVWFGRRNWLAYALVLWMFALRGPLFELLGNGNPSLDMQSWAVAAVAAISLIWAIAPGLARTRNVG
jgi:membrane protease YdiL (CAAX protease family)